MSSNGVEPNFFYSSHNSTVIFVGTLKEGHTHAE